MYAMFPDIIKEYGYWEEGQTSSYWTGGYYDKTSKKWKWLDYTNWTYEDWWSTADLTHSGSKNTSVQLVASNGPDATFDGPDFRFWNEDEDNSHRYICSFLLTGSNTDSLDRIVAL